MIKADAVKPHYEKVKEKWAELLSQYYLPNGSLNPEFLFEVSCPYCQSTAKKENDTFVLNGFKHNSCKDCDGVYVSPRLKDECLEKLYNDEYYSQIYIESMIPAFETRKKLIGQSKFKQVLQYSKKTGRVLDIGCGIGEVIDVFKDNGWDCHTIEVNPAAIRWLKTRNIHPFVGPFNQYPVQEKFDVIMAWGVVEHVVDPIDFLKKVFSQLNPGGVFVSEVPSGQSLLLDYCRNTLKDPGRIIMGEQHIVLHSVKAYEGLHKASGLEKLHVQTNGLDIETILKVNKQTADDTTIFEIQKYVDAAMKGDLIRGFWKK